MDFVVTLVQPGATGRISQQRKSLKSFYFGPLRFPASGFESRWGRDVLLANRVVRNGLGDRGTSAGQIVALRCRNAGSQHAYEGVIRQPRVRVPFPAPEILFALGDLCRGRCCLVWWHPLSHFLLGQSISSDSRCPWGVKTNLLISRTVITISSS